MTPEVVTDPLPGSGSVAAVQLDGDRRDLRLDACRGLALWFIFIDHIPDNALTWLTLRNYGFSDTSEVFVFVSGYTCMLAYGGALPQEGWLTTVTRAMRRSWEIYAAFLLLLIAYFVLIWLAGGGSRCRRPGGGRLCATLELGGAARERRGARRQGLGERRELYETVGQRL